MSIRLFLLIAACSMAIACGGEVSTVEPSANASVVQFDDATERSGIDFKHAATRTEKKWLPEIMGSGVAIADFDRNGAPDVYLVNSGAVGSATRPATAGDRLHLNDGTGSFRDASTEWGVGGVGYGQGVAVGDVDNDGWTDVFLTNYEGNNRLLKNTGSGFDDVTDPSGIKSDGKWATSAAFFDYDRDGDLDLYIVRYVDFTTANARPVYRNRMLIYSTPIYYEPVADQLWQNDGTGKFRDVTEESGIGAVKANGLALAVGDVDGDGDEDIYVANDSDANLLWVNDHGKFRDICQPAGCAYSEVGQEEGSMGADLSDTDGNGLLDIIVTNFQNEPTSLYRQTERLLFREMSDAVGIGETSRQRLSFGIDFADVDNDGLEDVLMANGHIEDNVSENSETVTFPQLNSLYRAIGGGKFEDVTGAAGKAFENIQVSRGLATGDLNSDGLLDFVVNNNDGPAQVAFNTSTQSGNFVILWLEGAGVNRSAIGTTVTVKAGGRELTRSVMGAQSYLSVSDFRLHFGLGDVASIDEIVIRWPGKEPQTIRNLPANAFFWVREGQDAVRFKPGERQLLP